MFHRLVWYASFTKWSKYVKGNSSVGLEKNVGPTEVLGVQGQKSSSGLLEDARSQNSSSGLLEDAGTTEIQRVGNSNGRLVQGQKSSSGLLEDTGLTEIQGVGNSNDILEKNVGPIELQGVQGQKSSSGLLQDVGSTDVISMPSDLLENAGLTDGQGGESSNGRLIQGQISSSGLLEETGSADVISRPRQLLLERLNQLNQSNESLPKASMVDHVPEFANDVEMTIPEDCTRNASDDIRMNGPGILHNETPQITNDVAVGASNRQGTSPHRVHWGPVETRLIPPRPISVPAFGSHESIWKAPNLPVEDSNQAQQPTILSNVDIQTKSVSNPGETPHPDASVNENTRPGSTRKSGGHGGSRQRRQCVYISNKTKRSETFSNRTQKVFR